MGRPGTFQKGHKSTGGCPKGHKRISPEAGRDWAMRYLDAANATMLKLMKDENADPGVRLRAALAVQERAWGKVPQAVEGVTGGVPIELRWGEPPL